MHFSNMRALADELKAKKVSQRNQLIYLLGIPILLMMLIIPSVIVVFSNWEGWSILFDLFIVIVGIMLCFRVNQKGDNEDFILRFTCLQFPALLQTFVLIFITFVVLGLFKLTYVSAWITKIFLAVYFILIYKYMRYVSVDTAMTKNVDKH